jgi:type IV pilus assembly protein PilC
MRIDNQTLWLFADSMATCLASGMPAKKSLEMSGAGTRSKALQEVVRAALKRCDQGMPLSEALEPGVRFFPRDFLPVIRAGETSGRLVEAFQLLSRHCHRVGPSVRLVRNTWLYPLICIVFGWVIRTGVFVYFGKYQMAWHFVCASFGAGSLLVLLGWLLFQIEPVKRAIDLVLLQIPLIRETEIRLAVVLFFATFRLAYEAGGLGVVVMFDLAWQTVRNGAIRRDLLKARQTLAENGTFGDAFGKSALLEDDIKGMINTGSISGKLDRSLTQIVETATQQLEITLQTFNRLFQRLVAFSVAMTIVETVLICVLF